MSMLGAVKTRMMLLRLILTSYCPNMPPPSCASLHRQRQSPLSSDKVYKKREWNVIVIVILDRLLAVQLPYKSRSLAPLLPPPILNPTEAAPLTNTWIPKHDTFQASHNLTSPRTPHLQTFAPLLAGLVAPATSLIHSSLLRSQPTSDT